MSVDLHEVVYKALNHWYLLVEVFFSLAAWRILTSARQVFWPDSFDDSLSTTLLLCARKHENGTVFL